MCVEFKNQNESYSHCYLDPYTNWSQAVSERINMIIQLMRNSLHRNVALVSSLRVHWSCYAFTFYFIT